MERERAAMVFWLILTLVVSVIVGLFVQVGWYGAASGVACFFILTSLQGIMNHLWQLRIECDL